MATSSVVSGGNEYLRPVDALMLFRGGEVLLLSEREADALLELQWQRPLAASSARGCSGSPRPLLLSLPYARVAYDQGGPGLPRLAVQLSPERSRPPPAAPAGMRLCKLVSLQLFNGDTSYSSGGVGADYAERMDQPRMRELVRMVRGRLLAAEQLVGMHGKQVLLPRSDLELVCDPDPWGSSG